MEKNVAQAAKDMQKVLSVSLSQIAEDHELSADDNVTTSSSDYPFFSKEFLRRHGRDLFACAAAWFLVDVVFYSSNLLQFLIYKGNIPAKYVGEEANAFQEAIQVAKLQAIIALCSTIPGYFVTVYLIDRIGRVPIQFFGFLFMSLSLLAIGIPYEFYWKDHIRNKGFMALYGLTFFFSNFGPNTTTFIVPAELFPTRFRATCHGISGAIGKIGAIIGSVGFLWAAREEEGNGYKKGIGMTASLVMLGGVCVAGMMVTYFFTQETKGRSLEENESEDELTGMCVLRCAQNPCVGTCSPGNRLENA